MKDITITIPEETNPSPYILGEWLTGQVQLKSVLLMCHLNGTDPHNAAERLKR